jgi:hypothetical protein
MTHSRGEAQLVQPKAGVSNQGYQNGRLDDLQAMLQGEERETAEWPARLSSVTTKYE